MDEELTAGTIAEVQGRVGDDVELARQALAEESAKGDDARSTLVEWLQHFTAPDEDEAGDSSTEDGVVGPERFIAEADEAVDSEAEALASEDIGPERYTIKG